MASRRPRPSATGALGYKYRNHMEETLTRLGITPEQFQAKQTELVNGLLQNEPFVPTTTSNNRHLALYEKVKFGGLSSNRSRSSSLSSESSRAPSPTLPRTPMKADSSIPPRPRDQMEMVIESRNKLKATQRRGVSSICVVIHQSAQRMLSIQILLRVLEKTDASFQSRMIL